MTMKNKYIKRAHISERKFQQIVRLFSTDLDASQIARLTGLNRNTVNRYYRALRERIAVACEAERPFFGIVEVDETWFGPKNVPGKRGRGAGGKTIVFGIHERRGRVFTEVVPDTKKVTLQRIIRGRVTPSSLINSDTWVAYDGLVELGYGHFRINHADDEFARGSTHINGIEGFWGLAKVRLAKFKGVPRETFHLHLKETEWRYNMRHTDKYRTLLRYLRENPLS